MKTNYYTQDGKKAGTVDVSDAVFGAKWNEDLVAQVVKGMMANKRNNVANSLTREEVRGGGRKPWKQKGTGRARHGSSRSPIWVGGGKAHGPKSERDYTQKINKKMRAGALYSVLSQKMKEGNIVFVDSLNFKLPKTAEAKQAVVNLAKGADMVKMAERRNNAILVATGTGDTNVVKSFANMGNVQVMKASDLNPMTALSYKYIVMSRPEASSTVLAARMGK
jgi:large subunit ribosomal protein L4